MEPRWMWDKLGIQGILTSAGDYIEARAPKNIDLDLAAAVSGILFFNGVIEIDNSRKRYYQNRGVAQMCEPSNICGLRWNKRVDGMNESRIGLYGLITLQQRCSVSLHAIVEIYHRQEKNQIISQKRQTTLCWFFHFASRHDDLLPIRFRPIAHATGLTESSLMSRNFLYLY